MKTAREWIVIVASASTCMSILYGIKLITEHFGIFAGLGLAVALLIGAIVVLIGSKRERP